MVFVLRGFLDGRRLLGLRLIAVSVHFHLLRKFADVVKAAAYLGVVLVNETAGLFRLFSPRIMDNDFAAVWDAELLVIVSVDKADALLGFLDRFACASASMSRTFLPCCARLTPRLTAVVVLPTPPF